MGLHQLFEEALPCFCPSVSPRGVSVCLLVLTALGPTGSPYPSHPLSFLSAPSCPHCPPQWLVRLTMSTAQQPRAAGGFDRQNAHTHSLTFRGEGRHRHRPIPVPAFPCSRSAWGSGRASPSEPRATSSCCLGDQEPPESLGTLPLSRGTRAPAGGCVSGDWG